LCPFLPSRKNNLEISPQNLKMEKNFSLFDLLLAVLRRRNVLLINFLCVFLISIGISLLLPKSYKSTVVFMPPGQSSSGILSMLGNDITPDVLMGSKFSKRQYIALLRSRELREQLIHQFDLIKVYKLTKMINSLDLTLKALDKNIIIKEDEEGGLGITDVVMVNVTVVDGKPQRASDMANCLFDLLEKKVLDMSQREYIQQIDFLNLQMSLDDSMLTHARKDLKTFQLNNKLYDIPSQVKLTVRSLAQMEADKMSLEIQKSYLQKSFSSQYSEVKSLNEKLTVCNQKISELEKNFDSSLIPSLEKSLDLSDEYLDLFKEVETYVQLKFLLRQQLEIAKLKQCKSYSGISLVDHARPAQYKFKPKRAAVVLFLTFAYMALLLFGLLFKDYFEFVRSNYPEKISALFDMVRNVRQTPKK
jgi:tyrosine-protein kinase Etk/Wzc